MKAVEKCHRLERQLWNVDHVIPSSSAAVLALTHSTAPTSAVGDKAVPAYEEHLGPGEEQVGVVHLATGRGGHVQRRGVVAILVSEQEAGQHRADVNVPGE